MFTLDELAQHHGTDKSTKFHGYAPVYDRLFTPMRFMELRLLEIGVAQGYSVRTWLDYFPAAKVIGVDIDFSGFVFANLRYQAVVANQSDAAAMQKIGQDFGPFDIVIDDGCHLASAAFVSFEALWPHVSSGGFYVIEDVFTYWHPMYQSSAQGWTWLHGFIDDVNQRGKQFYGAPAQPLPLLPLEQTLKAAHFYKGLVVLEKQ